MILTVLIIDVRRSTSVFQVFGPFGSPHDLARLLPAKSQPRSLTEHQDAADGEQRQRPQMAWFKPQVVLYVSS